MLEEKERSRKGVSQRFGSALGKVGDDQNEGGGSCSSLHFYISMGCGGLRKDLWGAQQPVTLPGSTTPVSFLT